MSKARQPSPAEMRALQRANPKASRTQLVQAWRALNRTPKPPSLNMPMNPPGTDPKGDLLE